MKKILLVAGIAAAFGAGQVLADNTDSAVVTVAGRVITALEITQATATLTVPDVVVPDTTNSPSTVTIACTNAGAATVAYSDGANPFADGTTGAYAANVAMPAGSSNAVAPIGSAAISCVTLAVTGETGLAYTFPAAPTVNDTAVGDNVTATATCASTGLVGGNVYCGGTVSVTNSATAGNIADIGTFTVVVTYD